MIPDELKKKMSEGRAKYWQEYRAGKEEREREKALRQQEEEETEKIVKATKPSNITGISQSREAVVYSIYKSKDDILKALIDSAKGLKYVKEDGTTIYTKKPDTGIGEYLLNQLIGKPKENIEVKSVSLNVDF